MQLPITQMVLMKWAGLRSFQSGKALFDEQRVRHVEYEHPFVRGLLSYGQREMRSQFELLADGTVDNQCPCRENTERGVICSHLVALGLELIRRNSDPDRARKLADEARRAANLQATDPARFIKRVPAHAPGALAAGLHLELAHGWQAALAGGSVPLHVRIACRQETHPPEAIPRDWPLAFSQPDENLLFTLEDMLAGPATERCQLPTSDFLTLLELHAGKTLREEGRPDPHTVNLPRMTSRLRLDLDRENGELILDIHTALPFQRAGEFPLYLIGRSSGWVHAAGHFWPLEKLLPDPLREIYQKPVVIARNAVPHFMEHELPRLTTYLPVDTELTLALFTIEPARPVFRLEIRGSPASLAAALHADYGGMSHLAGRPNGVACQFAVPDPADILRYLVRNPSAEQAALQQLARLGMVGGRGDDLTSIVGNRAVLNFLGSGLPLIRRMGWKVNLQGRVEPFMEQARFVTPVVHIDQAQSWFEVGFRFEDSQGQSLSEGDIQRALLRGDAYVEKGGQVFLLDSDAIQSAREVFRDCSGGEGQAPGTFRVSGIYSAYVQSSLEALDGIDVETPPAWIQGARQQNRGGQIEEVRLPPQLEAILRAYQKDGVSWLHFLERQGFGGILADEMGLGKTLQALCWIQMERAKPEARGQPALIVCPTSLVENWAEEAAKFTPGLRVLTLSGAERHEKMEAIAQADLVVTSYALLRRDIDKHLAHTFSIAVLDEAQHIKNRSTQNSLAAKRIRAHTRVVLTGTPIENGVSDLWSIMDFLMPGYLGSHETFRQHYEIPIGQGGPDAESANGRLRRKLHPFLLRRLKSDVAKDLPPKIERVAHCTLSRDQQLVYNGLLEASRRRIADMVSRDGFNRSRMEILKTLLRLRQACCHLDLLKLPDLKSEYPSAKMDLFFELMDEAVDGGHRVLVFSQFTSMLAILRAEMEKRDLKYCYLDGATKERLKIVHEFNGNRDIPAFLISLKAGGTGLNLTGADMVIHFDPWWNPAVEDQATDRAYRIGQKRTVYSVKLITRDTVEEKVMALQKRKKVIIDATLTTDEEVMNKLSWEDIQEILNL